MMRRPRDDRERDASVPQERYESSLTQQPNERGSRDHARHPRQESYRASSIEFVLVARLMAKQALRRSEQVEPGYALLDGHLLYVEALCCANSRNSSVLCLPSYIRARSGFS